MKLSIKFSILLLIITLTACSSSSKIPTDVSKPFYDQSVDLVKSMEKSMKKTEKFSDDTNTKAEQFFNNYFELHPRFNGDSSKITEPEGKLALYIFDVHNMYSISSNSNDKEQIEQTSKSSNEQLIKVKDLLGIK